MNTPAHVITAAAIWSRPGRPWRNGAVVLGALLPDLSLYVMVFWTRFVSGVSFDEIFDQLYFSPLWQRVFAIDNSLPLWGLILALALWRRWTVLALLAGAALLHIATDLPLHHDDGRAHFWPFSDWKFESPISYWDPAHYGLIVGPLEALICVCLLVLLWWRFHHWLVRALILLGGVIELLPALIFPLMFGAPG